MTVDFLRHHAWVIWLAGAGSAVLFLAALIGMPLLLVRIRRDYFTAPRRCASPLRKQHPVMAASVTAMKNAGGAVLVLIGVVMCVTPGQGVLTVMVGLMLMDYPGKYRIEQWFITRKPVWRAVNWLRQRAHAPPLDYPSPRPDAGQGQAGGKATGEA